MQGLDETLIQERASSIGSDKTKLYDEIAALQEELRGEAKELSKLAEGLTPLAKAANHVDLVKLERQIEKARNKIENLEHELIQERGLKIITYCEQSTQVRRSKMTKQLALELASQAEALGFSMQVISREEPVELRIAPFSVLIDRVSGCAELRFAKHRLSRCEAEASAIVKQHQTQLSTLETGFSPVEFFSACHRAWLGARASTGVDRIEISEFLGYLALEFQSPDFRSNPSKENYRSYSRAHFAYHLLRLKQDKMLAQGGLRINLGAATGSSASDKKRVLWIEDETGSGEYKLNVYFSKVEAA